MKKIFLLLFFASTFMAKTFAQDPSFTQFYASPLNLNPALTGAFSGKYRLTTVYRDQWRSVTPIPLQTISAGLDLRFELDQKRKAKDAFSVGMVFTHDRTSIFALNTDQILLSGAFTKALSQDNTQFLTVAIQGGLGQKNINFDNLNFPNEFNGTSGFSLPDYENLPNNNFAYSDLSTGVNYALTPRRGVSYHIGGAVHHLFTPNVAFFEADKGGVAKLKRRYTAHLNATIPINARVQMSPRFVFQTQGSHAEINVGSNFRLQFTDYGASAMHIGGWARAVRNNPTKVGLGAAVAMVGFEFNNFLLGLSYDLNIRSVSAYQSGQGAFEISLGYLGDYDNDTILCPKF